MEIKRLNFWNMISGLKISAGQQAMSEWLNDSLVTLTDQTYSHSSTNSHLILKCKSNILSITSSNRNLHKKLHIHPQISRREFLLSYWQRSSWSETSASRKQSFMIAKPKSSYQAAKKVCFTACHSGKL